MKISNRDWIQLSAYLDGELSRKETDQLKRRIEDYPELQAALNELKTAKDILRKTPEIHVPRNFTLSPTQVGLKTRRPVYRKYRLAAAVMSIFLVGILVLDFSRIFLGGGFAPAMAPMAEELMMEKAVEDSLDIPVEEPALMAAEEEGDVGRSSAEEEASSELEEGFAEDATAPDAELAADGMAEEEIAPAAESEAQVMEEAAPAAGTQVGEIKATGEEAHEEELAADQVGDEDQANLASLTATPAPSPYPTQPPTYYEEPVVWEAPRRLINPFRILEIIFLLGVLGFGIAARVLRNRER